MESELHTRIRAKKILFGCGVESMNPALTELAGMVGYDLVWGDVEHGSSSPHQIELFCIAAKAGGALPIVRIAFTERTHVMRALEAGARLVAVPMVESEAMAREIVEYGKYKPIGEPRLRRQHPRAAIRIWGTPARTSRGPTRKPICSPRSRPREALRRCREIVGVEGISGGVIGPSDLSISLGKPLKFDDPEVQRAVAEAVRAIRSLDKIAICVSSHPALVRAALEAGAQAFVCAAERASLRVHWQQVLKDMQALTRTAPGG